MTDPGFSRGEGVPTRGEDTSLLFGITFVNNCMKTKKIGVGGEGGASLPPP